MHSMNPSNTAKAPERPILNTALFALLAFMITWGTGMLIVLSTHFTVNTAALIAGNCRGQVYCDSVGSKGASTCSRQGARS
jgi:hypothetical protein